MPIFYGTNTFCFCTEYGTEWTDSQDFLASVSDEALGSLRKLHLEASIGCGCPLAKQRMIEPHDWISISIDRDLHDDSFQILAPSLLEYLGGTLCGKSISLLNKINTCVEKMSLRDTKQSIRRDELTELLAIFRNSSFPSSFT